MREKEGEK
jgi:hypothetical protein